MMSERLLQFPTARERGDRRFRARAKARTVLECEGDEAQEDGESNGFMSLHDRFSTAQPVRITACDRVLRRALEIHKGDLAVMPNIWKIFLYSLDGYLDHHPNLNLSTERPIRHLHSVSSVQPQLRVTSSTLQFKDRGDQWDFGQRLETYMNAYLSSKDLQRANVNRDELRDVLCTAINTYVKGLAQN